MSLNQFQDKLDQTEVEYQLAEKHLDAAMRKFYAAQANFHDAERAALKEMVCRWCKENPCTCPKPEVALKGSR